MTDRTDFTQKPRTPGEKMREIEERVEALERDVPPPAEPPGSPTVEEAEDVPKRRECSVVFSENGKAWFLVSSESRADEVIRNRPGATKHRMVELREGEGIAPVAMIELASRSLALQSERDQLQARVKELLDIALKLDEYAEARKGGMATDG